MSKIRHKLNERLLKNHEEGEKGYRNTFPLSNKKVLVAYPSICGARDFPSLLKYMIQHFPKTIREDDVKFLRNLYKRAVNANDWTYSADNEQVWSGDNSILFSLEPPTPRSEDYLLYGLSKELWRIDYKDANFGYRQFIGQITEINSEERYIVLDSDGHKRRLNMSKISGASNYSSKWIKAAGTMKYALFTFEATGENERKVSWKVLPDDRSKTLLEALGLSSTSSKEGGQKEGPEESKTNTANSPLLKWKELLERKVSVRIAEGDGFKDYYFVLDHISWDPKTNTVEIGSKGLTLKESPDNFIVEPL